MAGPIRVLHILQRMEAGGIQAFLMNLYRNIDRSKVQFDFLVEYQEKQFYDDEIEKMGGRIYRSSIHNDYNIVKFNRFLDEFFRMHNEYKVVHVHAYTIGYFCLRAASRAGVPVRIAHAHTKGIIHDKKYPLKKIMKMLYSAYATDLFACSEEAGRYFFGNKAYSIIKNGIDPKKFIANAETRKCMRQSLEVENQLVIGNIGRLHESKNQTFLLHLFAVLHESHPHAALLIVGAGPLEKKLKEESRRLNLTNSVQFLGNRKDIPQLMQAMDVLVMPSLFEGLGIVAIEAQAAGVPAVCSTGFPPDIEITSLVTRKELSAPMQSWAEAILRQANNPTRHTDTFKTIVDAGFDIKNTAQIIQKYYINKYVNN